MPQVFLNYLFIPHLMPFFFYSFFFFSKCHLANLVTALHFNFNPHMYKASSTLQLNSLTFSLLWVKTYAPSIKAHLWYLEAASSLITSMSKAAYKQVNLQKGYPSYQSNTLWFTQCIRTQSHICSHFSLNFISAELALDWIPWTKLKWDFIFKKIMHTTKQISTTYLTEVLK